MILVPAAIVIYETITNNSIGGSKHKKRKGKKTKKEYEIKKSA